MKPAVWAEEGADWHLLEPVGFADEAKLHDLVEANPALLPLSGSPRLAVIGREVPLGPGYTDLLAVETTGRLVIVEVKLAYNSEARRAIVAQVLAYASYLRGMTRDELDTRVGPYLARRGATSVEDACAELMGDPAGLRAGLDESLATGRFRLVLVLDAAPPELVRLVGYLETIGEHLTIDLVQVTAYEVAGRRVLVPQRVDAERNEPVAAAAFARRASAGEFTSSPALFDASRETLPEAGRTTFDRLRSWAARLAEEGVARLESYRGPTYVTLLVRLADDEAGPVTVYNDGRSVYLSLYRTVLERRCPSMVVSVEEAAAPAPFGQGTSVRDVTDGLLDALAEAYRAAAEGQRGD